ncbi:major facilitator superfamily domain-containing protein [Lophiotrema nucula]|uniref:Major facilitator superfamily domain-containing protein n=1 Tax=Lophiotrema nucula TaxID=690887 RepID=A0A6A5YIY1_9PLEO|nr:major facilitator superfamily domain-containing protein [Lophiotrema nucula]
MSRSLDNSSRHSIELQSASTARLDSFSNKGSQPTQHLVSTDSTSPSTAHAESASNATDTIKKESSVSSQPLPETTEAPRKPPEYLYGLRLVLVMGAANIAIILITLNDSMIATAIPRITDEFNSVKDIGWYGSGYFITNCVFLPLASRLYTFYKTRYVFLSFLAVFEIGSLICATSQNSAMFIGGRVIAGVGAAGIFTGTYSIIGASVSQQRRPLLGGITMALSSTGLVAGPLVGGAITDRTTWRWCFYMNVPCGVAVMALMLVLHMPNSAMAVRPPFKQVLIKLDLFGFLLFSGSCAMLLLAVQMAGTSYSWSSPTIVCLFWGSGGAAIAWLAWSHFRGKDTLIPLAVFKNRILSFSCLAGFMQWGGLLLVSYWLPVWFQVVQGSSPLSSGLKTLPTACTQAISGLVGGWLVSKLGYYIPFVFFGSMCTAIGAGLMSTFSPNTPQGKWIGYQILTGTGRGLVLQMPLTAVQTSLPLQLIPVGTGLVSFAQYFGAALIVGLGETVFSNILPRALAAKAPSVEAEGLLRGGATNLRGVVPPNLLPGVLSAYSDAIDKVFYLAAGAGAASFVAGWGMGFNSVKKVRQQRQQQE